MGSPIEIVMMAFTAILVLLRKYVVYDQFHNNPISIRLLVVYLLFLICVYVTAATVKSSSLLCNMTVKLWRAVARRQTSSIDNGEMKMVTHDLN